MQLDYETMGNALSELGVDLDPSECHGVLCGLLCVNPAAARTTWVEHVANQEGQTQAAEQVMPLLDPFIKLSLEQLDTMECKFQPVMPDANSSIASRTQALGQWAQGFLVGMSFGGVKDLKELPSDSMEIMLDMTKIAQAGRYTVSETDEDDAALTEILEFLRAGVMLVYQELHAPKPSAPSGNSIH